MLTIKLPLKQFNNNNETSNTDENIDNIRLYLQQYTGLFHKTFVHQNMLTSEYNLELRKMFPLLDVSIIEECRKDVKTKNKQIETIINKNNIKIKNINLELIELQKTKLNLITAIQVNMSHDKTKINFKTNKKNNLKTKLAKVNKTLQRLDTKKNNLQKFNDKMKSSDNTGIVFGTKSLLKKITYIKNKINILKLNPLNNNLKNTINISDIKEIKNLEQQYILLKKEYRNSRLVPLYSEGKSDSYGNRKFKFDFNNNKIIFKPNKDNHISIEYMATKNQKKILDKLQVLCDSKQIPVTVRMSIEYIYITYDELKLTKYSFKEKEYKKDLLLFNQQNKEKITNVDDLSDEEKSKLTQDKKNIYIKHVTEQQHEMLKGKIPNRYMSIDLNPFEIGIVIADKIISIDSVTGLECTSFKFIKKFFIDLSKLNTKINKKEKSLNDEDYKKLLKKQNNKRVHEIKEAWKRVFVMAKHYKVPSLILEKLGFEDKTINTNSTTLNRNVKNYWHLELTKNLITKHCNLNGVQKVEVNPAYSSLIGNMLYKDYDCIASAMELLRRGVNKFQKGNKLYPQIEEVQIDKLIQVVSNSCLSQGIDYTNHDFSKDTNGCYVLKTDKSSKSGKGNKSKSKTNFKLVNKLLNKEFKSWNELYRMLIDLGMSYRNKSKNRNILDLEGEILNMRSHKSKVKLYSYNNI